MNRKIGLFFGSFNPIHTGHLIIANFIVEYTDLEEVWFVLSPHNPLKNSQTLLNGNHRLKMLEMAIEDNPRFSSCDIEFDLPKPSYTIDTLKVLSQEYPHEKFSIIMGSDNLEEIDKWKDYQLILDNHLVYVYFRLHFNGGEYLSHKNVIPVESPLIEISSTCIREAIKQNISIKYLVPEIVLQHIEEMRFYKDEKKFV